MEGPARFVLAISPLPPDSSWVDWEKFLAARVCAPPANDFPDFAAREAADCLRHSLVARMRQNRDQISPIRPPRFFLGWPIGEGGRTVVGRHIARPWPAPNVFRGPQSTLRAQDTSLGFFLSQKFGKV